MDSNTNKTNMDMLHEKTKKHTETSVELGALNAVDKADDVLLSLTSIMFVVIVVALFILFVNIGLSFFIVSGFYLVLALVLCFIYMFKDSFVKMSVDNLITAKSLKSKIQISAFQTYLKKHS
jgi:hypothetical protein